MIAPVPENTHPKKAAFLAAFRECGNVTLAANAAGVSRRSHYKWMAEDSEYATQFEDAKEAAVDLLEAEARRRATDGLRSYKFLKSGHPIRHPETGEPYYEHSYSDTLLIFLLKGARPEKYRDNVHHTGKVEHEHTLTAEQRRAELAGILHAVHERAGIGQGNGSANGHNGNGKGGG